MKLAHWALGIALFALARIDTAHAYPSFIGHGYTSCVTCHFNPYGNGPLNDYGRALSASTISARPFFVSSAVTDEKLAEASGFLGPLGTLPSWLRLEGNYRGLYLISNLNGNSKSRYITMQLEGSLVLKTMRDRLFLVITGGYVPPPAAYPPSQQVDIPTLISREHYLAFRPSKAWGVYAGFMDPVFGIRVPDHIAYSRSATGLAQNDQSHSLLLNWISKSWQVGAQALAGNLFQNSDLRQKGGSAQVEYLVGKESQIGTSILATTNSYRSRQLGALFTKLGFAGGSSLLGEWGFIREAPKTEDAATGTYLFLQNSAELLRGLYFLTTLEAYKADFDGSIPLRIRATPGIQWFPMQRLEFRFELQVNRAYGDSKSNGDPRVNPDILNLMSQVHVSL